MRIISVFAASCVVALSLTACGFGTASSNSGGPGPGAPAASPASPAAEGGVITGFAFVDSSVTGQGSRAKLPAGAKIYPPGSTVTGSEGCPTTRYQTDGQLVVVIDYNGRQTAGSVAVTRHPAGGGTFENAPYYLDLNPGRTLQFLGPIFDNGSYDVKFSYDYNLGAGKSTSATIVLARNCPAPR